MPALVITIDIFFLELGAHRQDYISKMAIILQPGMLGQNEFDLGASQSFNKGVAIIPAGGLAGAVRPDHMNLGPAFSRERCTF